MRALVGPFAALLLSLAPVAAVRAQIGIGDPIPFGDHWPFVRGDANTDGQVDIADAIRILDHLFPAGPPSPLACRDAADCNDDEGLDVADAVYLLSYLFSAGGAPPAPFGACGPDPTAPQILSCMSFPPCAGYTDRALAGHLLRRMAYGPTPALLDEVTDMGTLAFIAEQLDPASIDESANDTLNDLIATLSPETNRFDLLKLEYARGLYSRKQLLEQLADFWNNHFNTRYWTVQRHFRIMPIYTSAQAHEIATSLEFYENETFRDLALGSFLDLLTASATSPAMLIYLDNIVNVADDPNENYARELFELHTMGVDSGYVQVDIEQAARCFTGWTIRKKAPADFGDPLAPALPDDAVGVWSFHFDPATHDYEAKVIFEGTPYELVIPPGDPVGAPEDGLQDGMTLLAHVAGLQQTAEFVSTKLIRKFVDDEAPPALVAQCIGAWLASDGDLTAVLDTILISPEFLGPAHRWQKLETPMESVLSTVRAFDGYTTGNPITTALSLLNHLPHYFPTPDGFPEVDSLGTSKLLERIRFNSRIATATDPSYDPVGLLEAAGVDGADEAAVVDFFLDLLYQGHVTVTERQLAIDFLATDDFGAPAPLDPAAGDYDARIRKLAAFLASYPQGTRQ